MTKFGQVTAYDTVSHMATIQFDRPDACKKCGACSGKSETGTIRLKADCCEGDWVRIEFPESRFVGATLLSYGVPLAGLLAGLCLGSVLFPGNDLLHLGFGLLGLALLMGLLRLLNNKLSDNSEWTPHVAEVYATRPAMEDYTCGA